MANVVVTGMQWGDEGKGKIVDLLAPAFDVVVRFQGGNNAGHTVKFEEKHFALHLIPSGIVRPEMRCVLGNGMVIPPDAFFEELERLEAAGVEVGDRLRVSDRAHVILPLYAALDRRREAARGAKKIGTTARGIGPAYESKAARRGLRIGELAAPGLDERLASIYEALGEETDADALAELARTCRAWGERLAPFVADTGLELARAAAAGESLLFEGAQGVLLDVDHGTYPYVTSSNSTAGGAATGSGVAPTALDGSIGVLKAYTTRVGEGPFPTELGGETGEFLRRRGNEFGTTTGRPRRCGWLDLVVARYARRVNGVDVVALTKLDVLDELEKLKICVAYRVDGREIAELPASIGALERTEPVWEEVPGWRAPTAGTLAVADLPAAARAYVERIERALDAPVGILSTGPRREETIVRDTPRLAELTGGRLAAARG